MVGSGMNLHQHSHQLTVIVGISWVHVCCQGSIQTKHIRPLVFFSFLILMPGTIKGKFFGQT